MSSGHCLNCGKEVQITYCPWCGQSKTTHRLSLKHFVAHDMVHGIWHLDKGLIHTISNLLIRPGKFVHEYIAGKRVGHFNVLTLLVLLSGLFLYMAGFAETYDAKISTTLASGNAFSIALVNFVKDNFKWLMLSFIPLFTVCSYCVFRRRKYYFTEQLVINAYLFAGAITLRIFIDVLSKIPYRPLGETIRIGIYIPFLFLLFAYWQTWKDDHSFLGWLWRLVACWVLMTILFVLILFIGVGIYFSVAEKNTL